MLAEIIAHPGWHTLPQDTKHSAADQQHHHGDWTFLHIPIQSRAAAHCAVLLYDSIHQELEGTSVRTLYCAPSVFIAVMCDPVPAYFPPSRLMHFRACIKLPCHLDCRRRGCAAGPGAARALCWAPPNVLTSCTCHLRSHLISTAWKEGALPTNTSLAYNAQYTIQHTVAGEKTGSITRAWRLATRWIFTIRAAGIKKIQFFCTTAKVA